MMEHILFIFVLLQVAVVLLAVKFIHIYTIRQSEKALRVGEERYRTLVENLNVGVYRSTGETKGRYLQVNPAMIKIFGYESVEEFTKISISDLYRDPEGRIKFVDKIKGSWICPKRGIGSPKKGWYADHSFRHRGGTIRRQRGN